VSEGLDNIDRVILETLQDDARTALRKIAEKTGVSEATIFARVKKLQEKGVIKRFTALVSPELLGKSLTAFVLINTNPKSLQTVLASLKGMNDVYEAYDITGSFYAIAKIRASSREELAKLIDQIGLIDGVTSTETAIVLRCIKEETRVKI
jgi:Lrp/AsnC family transcriptional regulator for asnA, asnC and gidA